MAVFRVEKTKDFTVMSNHHLRNTELSLKAKGLLSDTKWICGAGAGLGQRNPLPRYEEIPG